MATYTSIFIPRGGEVVTAALNATTSTAEIVFQKDSIIAINATGDVTIRFGTSGMAAASAADFRVPNGGIAQFDLGYAYDRIRLFNLGASGITYWILPLSRS